MDEWTSQTVLEVRASGVCVCVGCLMNNSSKTYIIQTQHTTDSCNQNVKCFDIMYFNDL